MDGKQLASEIKNHLNLHLDNNVLDVVLFGSQTKNTAHANSDYDILIILKSIDNRITRRKINDLCYDIDLKYNIFLDTQIISKDELLHGIRGKHPIFRLAIKEGIHA